MQNIFMRDAIAAKEKLEQFKNGYFFRLKQFAARLITFLTEPPKCDECHRRG